ncbi:MAG: FxsA family protein [Solirubrobacteraceae bacterium]
MPLILLLLLVGLPILEFYVILRVGDAIGFELTVVALVASSMLGVRLIRSQGRLVLRRTLDALAAGRPPALEAIDGALVFIGGVLLIVPGFATDLLGVLMLAPPTRAVLRGLVLRHHAARFLAAAARATGTRGGGAAAGDVDATAVELPAHELPR